MLESIDQTDLIYSILHFLLASPSDFNPEASSPQQEKGISVSRRRSMDALTAMIEEAAHPSPSLFNLRDLALLGLQSANEPTVLATLRLLTVILQRHPHFADLLVRTVPGRPAKRRTVGALNAELQQFFSMATTMVDDPTLDISYDNYLKDAAWTIESHFCIPLPAEENYAGEDTGRPLELRLDDPIMNELLGCLETFFSNSVAINLALTEILVGIASSHLMSLDNWILVDPRKYDYGSATISTSPTETPDILNLIRFAYREPSWSSNDTPALTAILQRLVQNIQQWRREVPDFDVLAAARRELLHQEEGASVSATPKLSRPSTGIRRTETQTPATMSPAGVDSPRGRIPFPRDLFSDETRSPRRSTVIGSSPFVSPARLKSPSRSSSISRDAAAEDLRKRLATPFKVNQPQPTKVATKNTNTEATASPNDNPDLAEDRGDQEEAIDEPPEPPTLGHVLTNVVVLYEFILELTAVVQVRGNLFGEAGYLDLGGGREGERNGQADNDE